MVAENPELTGVHSHGPEPLEIVEALEHDGALEEEKHPELHQTEVPVVVEQPQTRGKKLKHEEWSHDVFLVDLQELRNGHVHFVRAPN